MDRFPFSNREWKKLNRAKDQAPTTRPTRPTPLRVENLEGRVVMASGAALLGPLAALGNEVGQFFNGGGGFGPGGGFGGPGGFGHGGGTSGVGTSSVLGSDAATINKAFQTLNSAVLADVAALRSTATTTTGPTTAGITAYKTAVDSAVSALNATISSTLTGTNGLTNTGAALTSTIEGYTATLQTELESAGSGLKDSTSASVLATDREIAMYERTASSQSTQAVLSDAPTGSITGTTLQTFNKSVQTALQTFSSTINAAKSTAISSGTTLDSTTVSTAVSTLQTSLDSAISALGTSFTSSTYNPTTAVDTLVSGLTASLTAITAPTAGSTSSARTFSMAINSVLMKAQMSGTQLVATAITNYNDSLL